MSLLPQVLSVKRMHLEVSLTLQVRQDLDFFSGHFPGMPILPGVVQVDWAIHLAHRYFPISIDRFVGLRALKFSAPIRPGVQLDLRLNWHPESSRLDFTYSAGELRFASGQVRFSENVRQ